jgi:hypothetical protein
MNEQAKQEEQKASKKNQPSAQNPIGDYIEFEEIK